MSFQEAVESTEQIKAAYHTGLKALGRYSGKVIFLDAPSIDGSVDIDSATQKYYPNEHRWDYVVGYKGKAYFFEVHPASSGEVKTMKAKFSWLKKWLQQEAPALSSIINDSGRAFFWIYTKGYAIPKGSVQYRAAAEMGLIPVKEYREKL